MPRASMAELITRVRRLIADPAGADQTFSDDEIEEALDCYQVVVRYAPLRPEGTPLPSGTIEYRDYYAGVGAWEANEQLVDGAWQPVVPASADRLNGHWTFASPGQPPPIYVTGQYYDVHGAAADLLERWAARVKTEFDFSTDGQSFSRSQKARTLLEIAREMRRRQRPAVAVQVRPDLAGMEVW